MMFSRHPSGVVRGLYQDICSQVEDDTPRLILADWLEENGDKFEQTFARDFLRFQIYRASGKLTREQAASRRDRIWMFVNAEEFQQRSDCYLSRPHRGRSLRCNQFTSAGFVYYRFRRGFPAVLDQTWLGLGRPTDWLFQVIAAWPIEAITFRTHWSSHLRQWRILAGSHEVNEILHSLGLPTMPPVTGTSGLPKRLRMLSRQILDWARRKMERAGQ